MQPNVKKKKKKEGSNLNPSRVDSIGQIKHYFGSWKGDAPSTDILQSGALLYYIPPLPSPTPGANVAKTGNDSMRGGRIGLLGQTISIIHRSVDLLFLRVQCKQAPSHEEFVYCWAFAGFPGSSVICLPCRRPPVVQECRFHPWFGKICWRRKWQPTPVFFPGESHGQRSWQAIVHGVSKNQTRLKWLSTHACKEGMLGTMINISGRLRFKITFDQRRISELTHLSQDKR